MNIEYDNNIAKKINGFPDERMPPVTADTDESVDIKHLLNTLRFGISDLWKIRNTRKIFRYYR